MPVVTGPRLDVRMVQRGLARSRRRAAELVAEGRVTVAGAPARKPSQAVAEDDLVQVGSANGPEYVSRAAHKLSGALDAAERLAPGALRVAGARCLDAGASTGGFTQVLLERGAGHVRAVDVGHGQLAAEVAADPRVTVYEGTNVRDLLPGDLGEPADLVVADLSFISLRLVVGPLIGLTAPGGHLLVMVKPQFEVGRERLGARGVVASNALRQEAVLLVATVAMAAGANVRAVVPSPLPGSSGNREYFLWLEAPGAPGAPAAGTTAAADDAGAADPIGPVGPVDHADHADLARVEAAVVEAVDRDRPVLVGSEDLS